MDAKFAALTGAFTALILFVSLYPFRFHAPAGVLATFLASADYFDPSDCASNVLLYLPLGFFAALSFRDAYSKPFGIAISAIFGTVLSLSVELIQTFDATRASSVWDFYSNSLGAALGALAGAFAVVETVFPAVMVMCWVGFRAMSPYVPPAIATEQRGLRVIHFSLAWLSLALLLEPLTSPRLRRWSPAFVLAITLALQIWLGESHQLAEAAGGLLALAVWSIFLYKSAARARAAAWCIVFYVALDALRPFHFMAAPRHFGWVPFLSIIHDNRASLVSSTLSKVFMYGTLLWTIVRAGWPPRRTIMAGTFFVLVLRLIQVYLPGRTSEITDPVMTVLLGACLMLMNAPPSGSISGLIHGRSHEAVTDSADGEQMAGTGRVSL